MKGQSSITKKQKRKLTICPVCKKHFYYWQYASIHADKYKHWGDYNFEVLKKRMWWEKGEVKK